MNGVMSEPARPNVVANMVQEGDGERVHPMYGPWRRVVPFPPATLMASTGAVTIENFLVVGESWAQVITDFIRPKARILDVGCGCGKTARMLMTNQTIAYYLGIDVIPQSIEWCRRFITPKAEGRFEFRHLDVYSGEYNPGGTLRGDEVTFPVADGTIDVAFAASVFTHLLENDARHYLNEIGRVLRPGGTAVLSIHLPADEGRFSGTEFRIGILPQYFTEMASAAGLRATEHLGELCGQETYVFTRNGA